MVVRIRVMKNHGSSETALTHNMAFLGILMHLFQNNITSMSRTLFLMSMQSLVQLEARGEMRVLLRRENYRNMSFWYKDDRKISAY